MAINQGSKNCCTFRCTKCCTENLKNTSKTTICKRFEVAEKPFGCSRLKQGPLVCLDFLKSMSSLDGSDVSRRQACPLVHSV